MTGESFKELISRGYEPFLSTLGFSPSESHSSGRHYRATFTSKSHTLIIAIEPAESHLTVVITDNDEDDLAAFDDRARSPRLADLNAKYNKNVTPEERAENEAFFSSMTVDCPIAKSLVKCAKDLRLALPRFLEDKTAT